MSKNESEMNGISKTLILDIDDDNDVDDILPLKKSEEEQKNDSDDDTSDKDIDNENTDDEDTDETSDEEELDEDVPNNELQDEGIEENVFSVDKNVDMENVVFSEDEDEYDDDDDNDEEYYKFDEETRQTFLEDNHPESKIHNYEEITLLSKVERNKDGIVIDDNHRTLPFLTKFERTRILGQRAKQLDDGANSFVSVPQNIIDGYQIAELELEEKKIPFIIRRPLPNGKSEYWKIEDLEVY